MKRTGEILLGAALCKMCGICVTVCPSDVFDAAGDRAPVVARPEDCNACRACELHCPDFAIRIGKVTDKVTTPEQEVA
jgi:2-oxoglutarate ferredoxin oxidoreductase subunit delta